MNNCAKKFTAHFENYLECVFDDIYYDMKSSSKREAFFKVCSALQIKKLKPLKRPDHRWVYILTVLDRVKELWDALLVFYYFYLQLFNKSEGSTYSNIIEEVYGKRNVSSSGKKIINNVYCELKRQNLTKDAVSRKKRIINALFVMQQKTMLYMALFAAILPEFDYYIKLFESKTPLLHALHVSLHKFLIKFLTFFIKSEVISNCKSYQDLLKLDVKDSKLHLPSKLLYSGSEVSPMLKKLGKDHPISLKFKSSLMSAYVNTAAYMIKKLLLGNSCLISFTALDPELRGKTTTMVAFEKLTSFLSHMFSDTEKSQLLIEIRLYQTDIDISDDSLNSSTDTNPIDEYWSKVFALRNITHEKKYPMLERLVKACLSCFHAPLVEGAFCLMDRMLTDNRASLKIDSLDAIQTVKYELMATKQSACEKYGKGNPVFDPIDKNLIANMNSSWRAYQEDLKAESLSADNCDSNVLVPKISRVLPILSNYNSGSEKNNQSEKGTDSNVQVPNMSQVLHIPNNISSTDDKKQNPSEKGTSSLVFENKPSTSAFVKESLSVPSNSGNPLKRKLNSANSSKKQKKIDAFFKK